MDSMLPFPKLCTVPPLLARGECSRLQISNDASPEIPPWRDQLIFVSAETRHVRSLRLYSRLSRAFHQTATAQTLRKSIEENLSHRL